VGRLFNLCGLALALGVIYYCPRFLSKTGKIGKEGTPAQAEHLETMFDGLTKQVALTGNISRGGWLTFSEEQINSYFENKLNKSLNLESFSVDIDEDHFKVRMVRQLLELDLRFTLWEANLSYDLVCVPKGKRVEVRNGAIGRIPVKGKLATSVAQKIHAMLATQQEWIFVEKMKEIKIKGDAIAILVEK